MHAQLSPSIAPGWYLLDKEVALTQAHEASYLRALQEAGAPFAEALADLSDAELAHAGADSAGSRVLEAFLEGPAGARARKRALRKLRGSYARLAATPGGSHAVQACYRAGVRALACPCPALLHLPLQPARPSGCI